MNNMEAVQILRSLLDTIEEEKAQTGKVAFPIIVNENEVNAIRQLLRPHLKRAVNKLVKEVSK